MAPRILFLDDDPVIRVLRMVLSDGEHDPWIRDYFATEKVDASRLARAAKGLRRSDGAVIGLAGDGEFEDATAILFRRGEVNRQLLVRHPNLKLIQRLGERSQGIDLEAAAERGIRVSCLPRRTLHYTAEHGNLLGRSDFVSLNVSNIPENAGLANRSFFAAMRPSAFFINTSRGRLVDEDALYEALRAGTIAGAGLDVHAVEPRPAGERFAALQNVVRNCHAVLRGEPALHEVRAARPSWSAAELQSGN